MGSTECPLFVCISNAGQVAESLLGARARPQVSRRARPQVSRARPQVSRARPQVSRARPQVSRQAVLRLKNIHVRCEL